MPATREGKRYLVSITSDESLRYTAEDLVMQRYRRSPEFAAEIDAMLRNLKEATSISDAS